MAILGITPDPTTGQLFVPTEQATTLWGALGGIGGFLAQVVVANQLSRISGDQIALRKLFVPAALSILGTVGGAFLVTR